MSMVRSRSSFDVCSTPYYRLTLISGSLVGLSSPDGDDSERALGLAKCQAHTPGHWVHTIKIYEWQSPILFFCWSAHVCSTSPPTDLRFHAAKRTKGSTTWSSCVAAFEISSTICNHDLSSITGFSPKTKRIPNAPFFNRHPLRNTL